jgi:hypothetical protein
MYCYVLLYSRHVCMCVYFATVYSATCVYTHDMMSHRTTHSPRSNAGFQAAVVIVANITPGNSVHPCTIFPFTFYVFTSSCSSIKLLNVEGGIAPLPAGVPFTTKKGTPDTPFRE